MSYLTLPTVIHHILHNAPDVTPMKLQKLLYYSYAWSLVAEQKLFDAKFEKWEFGPVVKSVYQRYKSWGNQPIKPEGPAPDLTISQAELLNFIVKSYGHFSASELSNTTHIEAPWKKTAPSEVISDDLMVDYYKTHPFAKNFPLGTSKVYYPPKTAAHYGFVFDMKKDIIPTYPSQKDYLDAMAASKMRAMGLVRQII